jgi:hypothetical protein
MKRCPQCERTYEDGKNFCLEDGAPLAVDDPTAAPPHPSSPHQPDLPAFHNAPTALGSAWSQAGAWQQQPTNLSGAPMRKRKVWPWVVGVGVLLLGGAALVVGVAYVGYKAFKASENERRARVERVAPPAPPASAPRPAATKSPRGGVAAPTDRTAVFKQLMEIEREWSRANIEGDRDALEEILAEEYVTHSEGGGVESRADYLKNLAPNPAIESQEFEGSTVALAGRRAVLTGVTVVKFADGRTARYRFVDTFVWRDGRWLAAASVTTQL